MNAFLPLIAALVSLPGFHAVGTGPHGGTVLAGTFPGGERQGYVYVPPAYTPSLRYPVVYLLHGLRGSPSEYLYGTELARFADDGIASGALRPFVAVMPAAGPNHDYNGEWAGRWESEVVKQVVPWVDSHLSTVRSGRGRILAGLSAGGFGAVDIGLRHPGLFDTIETWGGYVHPLRDGPFKRATQSALLANDGFALARAGAPTLRREHVSFFVSTGPDHSHWFKGAQSLAFRHELQGLGLRTAWLYVPQAHGEWRDQLDAGLTWALARVPGAPAASGSGATSAGP